MLAGLTSRWTRRREWISASEEQTPQSKAHASSPRQRRSLAQVAPVEELHRVVRPRLVDAVVVDLDDPRVRELRQRVKFALEEGDHLAAARRLLGHRRAA